MAARSRSVIGVAPWVCRSTKTCKNHPCAAASSVVDRERCPNSIADVERTRWATPHAGVAAGNATAGHTDSAIRRQSPISPCRREESPPCSIGSGCHRIEVGVVDHLLTLAVDVLSIRACERLEVAMAAKLAGQGGRHRSPVGKRPWKSARIRGIVDWQGERCPPGARCAPARARRARSAA